MRAPGSVAISKPVIVVVSKSNASRTMRSPRAGLARDRRVLPSTTPRVANATTIWGVARLRERDALADNAARDRADHNRGGARRTEIRDESQLPSVDGAVAADSAWNMRAKATAPIWIGTSSHGAGGRVVL